MAADRRDRVQGLKGGVVGLEEREQGCAISESLREDEQLRGDLSQ